MTDTKTDAEKTAEAEAEKRKASDEKRKASVVKDRAGNPVLAFPDREAAEAQAKALGGKRRVEAIGVVFQIVNDGDDD